MDQGQDPVSMLLYRNIGSLIQINAEQSARIDQLKEFIWRHGLEVPEAGSGIKRANHTNEQDSHPEVDEHGASLLPEAHEGSIQKRFRSSSPTPADRSENSVSSTHATINSTINSTLGSTIRSTPTRADDSHGQSNVRASENLDHHSESPAIASRDTTELRGEKSQLVQSSSHPNDPKPDAPEYSRFSGGMSWALHLEPSDAPQMSPAAPTYRHPSVGRILRTSDAHVSDPSMVRDSDLDILPTDSRRASVHGSTISEAVTDNTRHSTGDLHLRESSAARHSFARPQSEPSVVTEDEYSSRQSLDRTSLDRRSSSRRSLENTTASRNSINRTVSSTRQSSVGDASVVDQSTAESSLKDHSLGGPSETTRSIANTSTTDRNSPRRSMANSSAVEHSEANRSQADTSHHGHSQIDRSEANRSAADQTLADLSVRDRSIADQTMADSSSVDASQSIGQDTSMSERPAEPSATHLSTQIDKSIHDQPDEHEPEPVEEPSAIESSMASIERSPQKSVAMSENTRTEASNSTSIRHSTASIPSRWQRSMSSVVSQSEPSTHGQTSEYPTRSFVELSTVMLDRSQASDVGQSSSSGMAREPSVSANGANDASTADRNPSNTSGDDSVSSSRPGSSDITADEPHETSRDLSSARESLGSEPAHDASVTANSGASSTPKRLSKSPAHPTSVLKRTEQVFERIYGQNNESPATESAAPQERSRVSFMLPPSPRKTVQARFESSPLKTSTRASTGNSSRRSLPRARLSKRWSTATTDVSSASYYTARDSMSSLPNDSRQSLANSDGSRRTIIEDGSAQDVDSRRNSTLQEASISNNSRDSSNLADASIVSGSVDDSAANAERSAADHAVAAHIHDAFGEHSNRSTADESAAARVGSASLPISTPNNSLRVDTPIPGSAPARVSSHTEDASVPHDDSKKENQSPVHEGVSRRRRVGARKVYDVEADGTLPQIDPIVMDPNDISVRSPRPGLKF